MAIDIKTEFGAEPIRYPDSDGQPMADNTLQYDWIERIKGGLESLFASDPDVFVAGDLLWYPVEGRPDIRVAPDVLIAFGRPKGYRGSYRQWEEGDIPPQVVFEILSPGNRVPTRREGCGEMLNKILFYERFGVEEYYIYHPELRDFSGMLRQGERLVPIPFTRQFTSPRLGVRFEMPEDGGELILYRPDGRRFLSFVELEVERADAEARAKQESERANAEAEKARLEAERAERFAARLRELGVDPDAL